MPFPLSSLETYQILFRLLSATERSEGRHPPELIYGPDSSLLATS